MKSVPQEGTRWVWGLDQVECPHVIEVKKITWSGDSDWWVTYTALAPSPENDPMTAKLERFWERAKSIGGSVNDFSELRSEENQYKKQRCEYLAQYLESLADGQAVDLGIIREAAKMINAGEVAPQKRLFHDN